jgi:membrane protease subunit HflC
MIRTYAVVILLAIAAVVVSLFAFTVSETERALVLAFGKIHRADYEPGLHFKNPVYNVHKFDARILTLDTRPDRALTSEKKNVIVDSFVKWRIRDTAEFFKKTGGDERRALALLSQFVKKGVLDSIGRRTVQEVISGERAALMAEVKQQAGEAATELGIEVVDVRIKKVEFPPDVNNSVYQRMEKERATVAKTFRSEGEELAKGIRADAERQREEILADAYSESQRVRGEGDAVAARTYADAFGKNREFFTLYRSLNAYSRAFSNREDVLILKPDSEFFRYFNDPLGNQ